MRPPAALVLRSTLQRLLFRIPSPDVQPCNGSFVILKYSHKLTFIDHTRFQEPEYVMIPVENDGPLPGGIDTHGIEELGEMGYVGNGHVDPDLTEVVKKIPAIVFHAGLHDCLGILTDGLLVQGPDQPGYQMSVLRIVMNCEFHTNLPANTRNHTFPFKTIVKGRSDGPLNYTTKKIACFQTN